MMISLTLVNGSHHWPVIKWFLPCSTLDNCNHMDRIVLCGRRDKDHGYLFKALIVFPQVAMDFCISSMDPHLYSHGCSNLCLYDIDLHCMSGTYVQVWVLYHMDLRYILVATLVYSSHGSALYWSATMSWLLVSMSQNIDVLQMPTWRHAPIEPTFSPHSNDLFFQSSRLLYPSKTHALGGIPLYQNPVTIMW